MPLPNVNTLSLAQLVRYCQKRVAEAPAATQLKVAELRRQTADAETARRLATELGKARVAVAETAQRLAAEAAEAQRLAAQAQRLAAQAAAQHRAEAGEAGRLAAEAAKAERLAAAAEAALEQLRSSAVAVPGMPAALGGTGEVFDGWEETFIAQTGVGSLLQLIAVRSWTCASFLRLFPAPLACHAYRAARYRCAGRGLLEG